MKVLSIFSGTGSFTTGFVEQGDEVVHLDLFEKPDDWNKDRAPYEYYLKMDVKIFAKDPAKWLDELVAPGWRPDVIVGGPMCTAFSMAGSGSKKNGSRRWRYDGPFPFFGPRLPTDETSRVGCALVVAMRHIIRVLAPRYWFIENPMGGLLTLGFMRDIPYRIITYCRYGDKRMKPTVIWSNAFDAWTPRERCKNGDPCHVSAPRGAKTGTQGIKGARERGRMPLELSREIARACATGVGER